MQQAVFDKMNYYITIGFVCVVRNTNVALFLGMVCMCTGIEFTCMVAEVDMSPLPSSGDM